MEQSRKYDLILKGLKENIGIYTGSGSMILFH